MKKLFFLLLVFYFSFNLFAQNSPLTITDCVENNYFEIVDVIENENDETIVNHKICRAYLFKNEEDFDLYIKYVIGLNYLEGISMKIINDLKAIASTSNEDDTNKFDYKILKDHNAEFMVYIKYYTENEINYRRFYFVRLYKGKIYTSYNTKSFAF
ncbi:MAG: hypothetical protein J6T20_01915 [Treponema sp.]|nr:hypothetical protein [Treponema sp.]